MKNAMKLLGVGVLVGAILGAVCLARKKEEKKGVRHAAKKIMDSVEDFMDSLTCK